MRCRGLDVPDLRIADMEGQMKGAMRIPTVDTIAAFGRAAVALSRLGRQAAMAERDSIGLEYPVAGIERQTPRRFLDDDTIGMEFARNRRHSRTRAAERQPDYRQNRDDERGTPNHRTCSPYPLAPNE